MKLEPGELICSKCHGTGQKSITIHKNNNQINIFIKCPKCKGAGKLDWVENVVGKKSIKIWGQKTLKLYGQTS